MMAAFSRPENNLEKKMITYGNKNSNINKQGFGSVSISCRSGSGSKA